MAEQPAQTVLTAKVDRLIWLTVMFGVVLLLVLCFGAVYYVVNQNTLANEMAKRRAANLETAQAACVRANKLSNANRDIYKLFQTFIPAKQPEGTSDSEWTRTLAFKAQLAVSIDQLKQVNCTKLAIVKASQ